MLLAIAGECAGAVQVGGEEHGDGSGKMPLVDGDLERLLYGFPMDSFAYLSRGARISIAGAQDKAVLVREEGGGWSVPLGGAPSTHILKPESEEFPGLVENEWYCMELARKAGLETACVDVEVIGGKRVLVVERYDRRAVAGGGLERIHQEDMAQALGRREKYQLRDGPSAYEIARLHGVDPAAFLERMAFNWMIGNCDAHAKNYAILEPGTERARLAPAYDLVCTEVYPELGRTLALRLGQAKRPGDVDSAEHGSAWAATGSQRRGRRGAGEDPGGACSGSCRGVPGGEEEDPVERCGPCAAQGGSGKPGSSVSRGYRRKLTKKRLKLVNGRFRKECGFPIGNQAPENARSVRRHRQVQLLAIIERSARKHPRVLLGSCANDGAVKLTLFANVLTFVATCLQSSVFAHISCA